MSIQSTKTISRQYAIERIVKVAQIEKYHLTQS